MHMNMPHLHVILVYTLHTHHICAQNYEIWRRYDVVLTKTILLLF